MGGGTGSRGRGFVLVEPLLLLVEEDDEAFMLVVKQLRRELERIPAPGIQVVRAL